MISMIAAIGINNELGYKNKLLWNISEDMIHFKNNTMNRTIVMGRRTFESIGSRALTGRNNVVISTQPGPQIDNVIFFDNLETVLNSYDDFIVIGGDQIYRQFMPYADKLIITHVEREYIADTFFPEIDNKIWKKTILKENNNDTLKYSFCEYIK